jgi:hypothetical protein
MVLEFTKTPKQFIKEKRFRAVSLLPALRKYAAAYFLKVS